VKPGKPKKFGTVLFEDCLRLLGGLDHILRFVAFEACKLCNSRDLIPPLSPMGRSRSGRKRFTGNPYEVRVGSKAVLTAPKPHFRDTPETGHQRPSRPCRFRAISGHKRLSIHRFRKYRRARFRAYSRVCGPGRSPVNQKIRFDFN
jgi:hypothetical protein